ncbi:carbohydrate ABC transporter permease [Spirochaeta lutea]|uniref:ABC transporter permease n=1 Tax=Spirochaeta lutea TaxID=1480694 RepID=A0A098QW34_9SPIO|nr:sugar ABC transporter permease [Spirochaeta lutea]KGE71889.1 ABC transporter permease [Spirochaeta lutea]
MRKQKFDMTSWLLLLPALFAFVMVIIIPFIMGILYSFTDWSSRPQPDGMQVVGLLNYLETFKDPSFLYSFIVTTVYTALNMLIINVVAFILALLVTSNIKFKHAYRVGFFLPNLIGGLILGYIWQFIFNIVVPNLPLITELIPAIQNPANYILAERNSALMAIVIAGSWQYAGYIMMIYVAAIISVPGELFEAAKIDGAGPWMQLRTIIIPMTAQAFTVTLFLTLVQSFKQYDVNVSLTGGGPATTFMEKSILGTELLAMNIYNTAFKANQLAQSQARAVIFFLVLAVISTFQVRANKKQEIEL